MAENDSVLAVSNVFFDSVESGGCVIGICIPVFDEGVCGIMGEANMVLC